MSWKPRKSHWLILGLLVVVWGACTDYDHDVPDTSANRAGFERHVGFAPPSDVTDIYYFADELGADVLYQLSFVAAPETVERIVAALDLEASTPQVDGALLAYDFDWWDTDALEESDLYWKSNVEEDYWWMLWYHAETQRVYYLEYSV